MSRAEEFQAQSALRELEDVMARVRAGLGDMRAGKMVILADDEDRENEGDLCMAAEKCTPEAVNFMAMYGRGLICLAITGERARQLDLPMMVRDSENETPFGTAFTVSIEARVGVTTGISAADRARTIQVAIAPEARPTDLTPHEAFVELVRHTFTVDLLEATGRREDHFARCVALADAIRFLRMPVGSDPAEARGIPARVRESLGSA